MARPLRINLDDGIYHVTSRGLERRPIVMDDADRRLWMRLLGTVAQRRKWRALAWALMDNHFHLFVRTPHGDLSKGMHDLNSGYVTIFNRRHRRVGPLFQGRFGAVLVERDYHYWELSRYIHLNPVRAGMTDRADTYRWSSCAHFFQDRGAPDWLAWEEVVREHGKTLRAARAEYARYLLDDAALQSPSPLRGAFAGALYGSSRFVDRMMSWLKERLPDRNVPAAKALRREVTLDDIARAACAAFGASRESVRQARRHGNEARKAAILLAKIMTHTPVGDIGMTFGGIGASAVSNVVTDMTRMRREDPRLDARLREIESVLRKSEK